MNSALRKSSRRAETLTDSNADCGSAAGIESERGLQSACTPRTGSTLRNLVELPNLPALVRNEFRAPRSPRRGPGRQLANQRVKGRHLPPAYKTSPHIALRIDQHVGRQ